MPEVALQTLDLVGRELNNTLGEARTALETFVEQPENVVLLQRCVSDLHQVQGVLRLLEIFGAALLAEEMEQVTQYLLTPASQKNQAETLDALMRAMVQLPSYVERVLAGGRDLALVLLPLLNDLRAVRGSALLSEGTLLLLNLKSDQQARPWRRAPASRAHGGAVGTRACERASSSAWSGWIRSERPEQNLEILETVAHQIEQVATKQSVFQLWWVVGAIIEALRDGGLETGVSVKRLLGLADREILQLYTQGEGRYAQNPPVELLNNLLYYVARATSNGPKVTAVRALVPSQRIAERRRLGRTGTREPLRAVREADAHGVGGHPRGPGQGQRRARHLRAARRPARRARIAGGHAAQDRRHARRSGARRIAPAGHRRDRPLEAMAAGKTAADHAALVHIAATLINVEDRLDRDLIGLIVPKAQPVPGEDPVPSTPISSRCRLRCCASAASTWYASRKPLPRTSQARSMWARSIPGRGSIAGIKAGLLMLGKTRAAEIVDGIATQSQGTAAARWHGRSA